MLAKRRDYSESQWVRLKELCAMFNLSHYISPCDQYVGVACSPQREETL